MNDIDGMMCIVVYIFGIGGRCQNSEIGWQVLSCQEGKVERKQIGAHDESRPNEAGARQMSLGVVSVNHTYLHIDKCSSNDGQSSSYPTTILLAVP